MSDLPVRRPGGGSRSGAGSADNGAMAALRDLVGALTPLAVRRLENEIAEKLAGVPNAFNEYGYDAYGFSTDVARSAMLPTALMYRYYFRTEVHDIDRVPKGRVLLICNHAGQLPFDGAMLGMAMVLDATPSRVCRPMGEYWIPQLPFVSVMAARMGAMVGTPENCAEMLRNEEAVMVFPEGVRGINKMWSQRYKLQQFGTGFVRLALETGTPIVPVALIGSEEQQPGIANFRPLARLLGMPSFPITPTFPWLGPLGLLPLPVRYRFYFGEPIALPGSPSENDATIAEHVQTVRSAIEALFERGLAERGGVFR